GTPDQTTEAESETSEKHFEPMMILPVCKIKKNFNNIQIIFFLYICKISIYVFFNIIVLWEKNKKNNFQPKKKRLKFIEKTN
ncbi:MAG: hypothetical protein IKH10_02775, partial [Bacteroidetes bacterium]|nr:hypothetical protein [Bacteroidota bacterium]